MRMLAIRPAPHEAATSRILLQSTVLPLGGFGGRYDAREAAKPDDGSTGQPSRRSFAAA
jgi:hypothetical protein